MLVENLTGACSNGEQPSCGCPYLHLHVNTVCLDVHFEPDGAAHFLLDYGEHYESDTVYSCPSLEDAEIDALHWARQFFEEDEAA